MTKLYKKINNNLMFSSTSYTIMENDQNLQDKVKTFFVY